jgi:hypothetical protein
VRAKGRRSCQQVLHRLGVFHLQVTLRALQFTLDGMLLAPVSLKVPLSLLLSAPNGSSLLLQPLEPNQRVLAYPATTHHLIAALKQGVV